MNTLVVEQLKRLRQYCCDYKPKVIVWTFTYNHAPYLRDYFEGIIKQQPKFNFIAVVHDDLSTDNSAEIIKEYAEKYPDIICPIYEAENQYSKQDGSLENVMNAAIEASEAEYVALCEGDDYWTDPHKLQKQVDFLDQNPDYGLVHTNYDRLNQSLKRIDKNWGNTYPIVNGSVFDSLVKYRFIKTLTVLFRASLIKNLPGLPTGAFKGDAYYFYEIALQSKIHYINESMCMYRLLSESASHTKDVNKVLAAHNSYEILDQFYLKRAKANSEIIHQNSQQWLIKRLKLYIPSGRYSDFTDEIEQIDWSQIQPFLQLIFSLSKYKPLFYLISYVWKMKNTLRH